MKDGNNWGFEAPWKHLPCRVGAVVVINKRHLDWLHKVEGSWVALRILCYIISMTCRKEKVWGSTQIACVCPSGWFWLCTPSACTCKKPRVWFWSLQEPLGSGWASQASPLAFLWVDVLRKKELGLGTEASDAAACWLCVLDRVTEPFWAVFLICKSCLQFVWIY